MRKFSTCSYGWANFKTGGVFMKHVKNLPKLIIGTCLVIAGLISCQNPEISHQDVSDIANLAESGGKGSISINLETSGETARTIKPEFNFQYGVIQLTPYQSTPFGSVTAEFSGTSKVLEAFPGKYRLDAYLYAEANDSLPIAKGSTEEVIIEAGKSTVATVTLSLVELTADYTGSGTFTWKSPEEALMATITNANITVTKGDTTVKTIDLLSPQSSGVQLPVGYYFINATFKNKYGCIAQVFDALWIYKNHTSNFNLFSLTGADFNGNPGMISINWKLDPSREPLFKTDVKIVEMGAIIIWEIENQNYKQVNFYLDGTMVQKGVSTLYTLKTSGLTPGSHELAVVTYGQDGIPRSTSVRFIVKMGQILEQQTLSNFAKTIIINDLPVKIHNSTSDVNGDNYIVGHQNDTGILIKLDRESNVVWSRLPNGTTGHSYLNGIAIYDGNLYVTGSYTGSLNFGSGTITGTSSVENPLIMRFDRDGNNVWAKTSLTGTSYGSFGGIAVNHHGVFVSGMFYYTRDLGDGVLVKTNSWANFDSPWIVKYSHDGKALWGITSTQNRCASVGGLALNDDTLVAAGYTNGSGNSPFSWGNLPALNATGYNFNGWCAAFDPVTGTVKWNVLAPVGGSSGLGGITIYDGYVYTVGYYNSSVYVLNEDANDRGLLIKYDLKNGNVIWSKIDESVRSRNHDIKADQSGIYVAGYKTVNALKRAVFQKYNSSGLNLVTRIASGTTDSWYGNIAIDSQYVYLTGVQTGTVSFTYDDISEPVKGNSSENGIFVRYKK